MLERYLFLTCIYFFYFWTIIFLQMVIVGFPSPLTQPETPWTVPGVHDQPEPPESGTGLERDWRGPETDLKRYVPSTVIWCKFEHSPPVGYFDVVGAPPLTPCKYTLAQNKLFKTWFFVHSDPYYCHLMKISASPFHRLFWPSLIPPPFNSVKTQLCPKWTS